MCSKQYAPEICQKSCASIVVDTSNETKWPTLFLVTVLLVWLESELIIIVYIFVFVGVHMSGCKQWSVADDL